MADEVISRADARASGLKHYFTGNACRRGHLSKRHLSDKSCVVCKTAQSNAWNKSHPEQHIARVRRWQAAHPKPKKQRVLRGVDLQKKKVNGLRYRLKHREEAKIKAQQWRDADPARAKNSRNSSRAKHPDVHRGNVKRRRAKVRGAEGHFTTDDLKRIRKMQRNRCADCRARFTHLNRATLDHIIAIKNGGSNNPRNLQFLCSPCNSSKGASDPIEFARRKGRLI